MKHLYKLSAEQSQELCQLFHLDSLKYNFSAAFHPKNLPHRVAECSILLTTALFRKLMSPVFWVTLILYSVSQLLVVSQFIIGTMLCMQHAVPTFLKQKALFELVLPVPAELWTGLGCSLIAGVFLVSFTRAGARVTLATYQQLLKKQQLGTLPARLFRHWNTPKLFFFIQVLLNASVFCVLFKVVPIPEIKPSLADVAQFLSLCIWAAFQAVLLVGWLSTNIASRSRMFQSSIGWLPVAMLIDFADDLFSKELLLKKCTRAFAERQLLILHARAQKAKRQLTLPEKRHAEYLTFQRILELERFDGRVSKIRQILLSFRNLQADDDARIQLFIRENTTDITVAVSDREYDRLQTLLHSNTVPATTLHGNQ